DPVPSRRRGEISPVIGRQLADLLRRELLDEHRLQHWFARYMTRPKYAGGDAEEPAFCQDHLTPAGLQEALAQGEQLEVSPASRFAFAAGPDGTVLYVDGQQLSCPAAIAAWVKAGCALMTVELWEDLFSADRAGANLVTVLYRKGSLLFVDTE